MNNELEQYKLLLEALMIEMQEKINECNSYKLKLGEIQHVLNSKVKIVREGTIKQNESE